MKKIFNHKDSYTALSPSQIKTRGQCLLILGAIIVFWNIVAPLHLLTGNYEETTALVTKGNTGRRNYDIIIKYEDLDGNKYTKSLLLFVPSYYKGAYITICYNKYSPSKCKIKPILMFTILYILIGVVMIVKGKHYLNAYQYHSARNFFDPNDYHS